MRSKEYHYIKTTTRKRVLFSLLRVVLSYTVTSREFVCQISLSLKKTVLSNPEYNFGSFCFISLSVTYPQAEKENKACEDKVYSLEFPRPLKPSAVAYICKTEANEKDRVCGVKYI